MRRTMIAEFVMVAGRLSVLKSRALLPRPARPQEELDEVDLVRQLEAYRAVKAAAELLAVRQRTGSGAFGRGEAIACPPVEPTRFAPQPPSALAEAVSRWLTRVPAKPAVLPPHRVVSLREMISRITTSAQPRGTRFVQPHPSHLRRSTGHRGRLSGHPHADAPAGGDCNAGGALWPDRARTRTVHPSFVERTRGVGTRMEWMSTTDAAPESECSGRANLSWRPSPVWPSEELPALLEALLLVSPEPAELRDLADAAGVSVSAVEEALATLNDDPSRGWVVIRHRGTAHISSAPRFAPYVRRFLATRPGGAALERGARDTGAHRVSAAGDPGRDRIAERRRLLRGSCHALRQRSDRSRGKAAHGRQPASIRDVARVSQAVRVALAR